jgi:4'-phosphopantetheinyl transferase
MNILPGQIHVLSFAIDLPPFRIAELTPLLASDELVRADRFRFERDRGRCIAARGFLRTILGCYANRNPRDLRFDYGPFGKPALQPGSDDHRLHFNLSRSDGLGVLAIRLGEALGIDVERLRPFDDALAISKRMFAEEEHAVLMSRPEAEQSTVFFGYWTRKEAVVKSLGLGLSCPLRGFVLPPEPRTPVEPVLIPGHGGPATQWLCALPAPEAGFVAALATAGAPGTVECRAWAGG